jgi:hypothetical protein
MLAGLAIAIDRQLTTRKTIDEQMARKLIMVIDPDRSGAHVTGAELVCILVRDHGQHGRFDCL